MDKFLNIPEQDLVASGTTTAGTTDKLTDSSATFVTDGVAIGDIVHNSTDDTYTTVSAIDSETVLTVATTVPDAKAYFIHSATASKSQLVSCVGIGLIEQASTSTITIAYDDAAAVDVITITHVPVASGSEAMRDALQNDVISALQTAWTSVSNSVELPKQVIGVSIG
jgi:hypothetical protein